MLTVFYLELFLLFLNWCFPKIGLSLYLSFATFRFRSSLSFCLLLNLFVSALRLSFLLLIFAVFFFDHLVSSLPNMLQTCSKHSTSSQDDHLSASLFPLSPFPFAPHFRSVVSSFFPLLFPPLLSSLLIFAVLFFDHRLSYPSYRTCSAPKARRRCRSRSRNHKSLVDPFSVICLAVVSSLLHPNKPPRFVVSVEMLSSIVFSLSFCRFMVYDDVGVVFLSLMIYKDVHVYRTSSSLETCD